MFNYFTHTIDNGLRLVFIPMPTTSVTVNLAVAVGSKNENEDIRGISHFLEHLAFKGTKRRPTTLKIAKELDKVGAIYNASTSDEKINYWIKSVPENFDLMNDIIADIVFHPLLQTAEIKREKEVIIEEMNMYEDTPSEKVGDLFAKTMFGDAPLGWEVIGKKETVLSLKQKDFRAYQKHFYNPSNMVLAIAGAFKKSDFSKIKRTAEKWFGSVSAKKIVKEKINWSLSGDHNLVKTKKTEQTHLMVGVPTFCASDKRRYIAAVLAMILGGNMSSRLWIKIRERRGWAYYIHALTNYSQEVGSLAVWAGIKNEKAAEAISLIKEEMLTIAKNLTKKEVEAAKLGSLGRVMLSFESSGTIAEMAGSSWLLQEKIQTAEDVLKGIKKVTLGEVRAFCAEFFRPENFYLAAIGPKENLKK